jgi:hypothetical protein
VRTFVVDDFGKIVEPGLLLQEVCGGRFGGFFFNVRCRRSVPPTAARRSHRRDICLLSADRDDDRHGYYKRQS